MNLRSTTDRYGAVAVGIHWVTAVAMIGLLVSGTIADGAAPTAKASILLPHGVMGILVMLLTLLRVAWWIWADRRPLPVIG